jgi:dihydroorotate dehydrogenase
MYKSIIRPILFKFDPEEVHHFTFSMLKNFGFLTKLFLPKPIEDKRLEREVFGL